MSLQPRCAWNETKHPGKENFAPAPNNSGDSNCGRSSESMKLTKSCSKTKSHKARAEKRSPIRAEARQRLICTPGNTRLIVASFAHPDWIVRAKFKFMLAG